MGLPPYQPPPTRKTSCPAGGPGRWQLDAWRGKALCTRANALQVGRDGLRGEFHERPCPRAVTLFASLFSLVCTRQAAPRRQASAGNRRAAYLATRKQRGRPL